MRNARTRILLALALTTGSGGAAVLADIIFVDGFDGPQAILTVTRTGSGSGTVISSPAGIECGSTCSAAYDVDAAVILAAAPTSGSAFTGWGGACSGSGACDVVMDAAKSVSAGFSFCGPDGQTCGATVCTDTSACSFEGRQVCDPTGTKTQSCTPRVCSAGRCVAGTAFTQTAGCSRVTEGEVCGGSTAGCPQGWFRDLCCSAFGACTVSCTACEPF